MKIGDYVRTKYGIAKYISDKATKQTIYFVIDKFIVCDNIEGWENCLCSNEIIKSSPNIIDLIEENDLVKIEYYAPRYNKRVERIFEVEYKDKDWIRFKNSHCELCIFHHQWSGEDSKLKPIIKSIVTCGQFESMEYKL